MPAAAHVAGAATRLSGVQLGPPPEPPDPLEPPPAPPVAPPPLPPAPLVLPLVVPPAPLVLPLVVPPAPSSVAPPLALLALDPGPDPSSAASAGPVSRSPVMPSAQPKPCK